MATQENKSVIQAVAEALGRTTPLTTAPIPPAIGEPIVRLVHADIGLPELFANVASKNKMNVTMLHVDELLPRLAEFLRQQNIRTIALPTSPLLERLGVVESLRQAGFDARRWEQLTLDELYDFDCGITDVWAAVAEIGALVIRPTPQHGRAISLVPPIHVAIIEPKNLVADLVDAMAKISAEPSDAHFTFITGPSKTADIEMNLVTGVHGPRLVHLFILQ